MKFKKMLGLTLLAACLVLPQATLGALERDQISVPTNEIFRLELLSPISTETNKKGDQFTCQVLEPQGFAKAYVSGHISKIKGSGKVSGNSEIAMAFEKITMPDEQEGAFSAQITEVYDLVDSANKGQADEGGTVKGHSTRKRDALKIAVAAGIGAGIGGILAGSKGAAIGGLIGASLAVTNTLSTKGPNLKFDTGTQFEVRTQARTSRDQ
jgi:hypothetical protein